MKKILRKIAEVALYLLVSLIATAGAIAWYYWPGASAVDEKVEVNFLYRNRVIIVKAWVNGSVPLNFILDTGTDPSVIDVNLAKNLSPFQLSIGEEEVGEDQPIEILMPLPMKLKVGDLPASRKMLLGIDISQMSEEMGMPIHGVLGHNFIRDNIMQIDYDRQVLTFFPSGSDLFPLPSQQLQKLELTFIEDGKLPRIHALNVKGKALNATIDTGSNQGLTLFRASVDYLGLKEALTNARRVESLSYGGLHSTQRLEGLDLKLGDWSIGPNTVNVDLESEKAQVGLELRGGNIGNLILENYLVTLDYQRGIVWFGIQAAKN